jgi:hypothetical protein
MMPCEFRTKAVSISFMVAGTAVSGSLQNLFARQLSVIPTYLVYDSGIIPQSTSPLAAWPRSRNVLGYEPWPQILNEPKSLYHSPSGTSGFDSIQTRS